MNFNITELLKLPNKINASISLTTGLILFLPDSLINKLYMNTLREKYGYLIGPVFLITFSILFISLTINIFNFLKDIVIKIIFKKNSKKLLMDLNTGEKAIIMYLYEKNNHSEVLPLNDGNVKYLEHKSIITQTANQYAVSDLCNPKFPYMLQPWVIKKIKEDEDIRKLFEKERNENLENIREILNELIHDNYSYY